jgi:hypothetical protein
MDLFRLVDLKARIFVLHPPGARRLVVVND